VSKVWAVARREFVERVRSRWFWISSALVPVFFAAVVLLPTVLTEASGTKRIVVVDGTPPFGAKVADALSEGRVFRASHVAAASGVVDSLVAEVGAKRLDGVLVLPPSFLDDGAAEYRASNVSSLRDVEELDRVLGQLGTEVRLERAGIDPALLARTQLPINLTTNKISGSQTTGESSKQSFSLAYFMGITLYTVILMYGVNVKSSVLEEKTTRIVEVLVSSVRPFALLLGKVLGVGAVSLFQLALWGAAGRALLHERAALVSRITGLSAASDLFQVPTVSTETGAVFVAYFLGGFFLYAAMFAAVGAMSSSEQEAQQAQQPIVLVLVLAFVSMFALLGDPNSNLSIALSVIPFTSPIAMPVRWAAGDLPPTELGVSLALLAVAIVGVTWIAARIYRVGILMTGKRPGIRELARWVRAG